MVRKHRPVASNCFCRVYLHLITFYELLARMSVAKSWRSEEVVQLSLLHSILVPCCCRVKAAASYKVSKKPLLLIVPPKV